MSIGSLIVEFEARTGKFETDTGRAAKIMERRAREIDARAQKLAKSIGTALGVGVAGVATGLGVLVKRAIDAGDEFNKLAQKTGISTEALSAWDFAAKQSGVEDLGESLIKLNRSMSEAFQGSKTQIAAFEALGVSIKDAQGNLRPTEQVLRDIADAFARFQGDQSSPAKVAIAMDLFSKSGAALIPLLNGGSKGLDQFMKRARELGLIIDGETAKASEQFNDALGELKFGLEGVGRSVAREVSPSLKRLAEIVADPKFAAGIKSITEAAIGATEAVARMVAKIGSAAANRDLEKLQREAAFLQETIEKRTSGKGFLEAFGRDVDGEVAELQKRLEGVRQQIEAIKQTKFDDAALAEAEALEGVGQEAAKAAGDVLNYAGAAGKADTASKKAKKSTDEWATALESAANIAAEADRVLSELDAQAASVIEGIQSPEERFQKQVAELERLHYLGKLTDQQFARARLQADETFIAMTTGFEKIAEQSESAFGDMQAFAEAAADGMQSALADFFFDPFEKGLDGMVASFARAMQRIAAEQAALQVFDFVKTSGSGGLWDFVLGIGGGLGGDAPIDPPPGRASGGSVFPGMPYIVGERGPELMVPKTAGTIVPNDKMGGVTVQNNITLMAPKGTVSEATQSQVANRVGRATATAMRKYS